jgi:hypothetical protein
MDIIGRFFKLIGVPCRECGGKGYAVQRDVAEFIDRVGLAKWQAAKTLLANEPEYGALGSIPCTTWMAVGLSEQDAIEFVAEIGHLHTLWTCPVCHGQPAHPDPLSVATDIIADLKEDDRRRLAEWRKTQTNLTPEERRQQRRQRMRRRMGETP